MLRQFLDLLRFNPDTRRVRAKVDFMSNIIKVPPKGVAVVADRDIRDILEIRLILQWRECRPLGDHVCQIIFARKAVIEGDAQNRIAHDFDAFNSIVPSPMMLHSSIMPS